MIRIPTSSFLGAAASGLVAFFTLAGFAADSGDSVVVVYNRRLPESKAVAEHYGQMRHVPANQLVGLLLPVTEAMTRPEFRDQLQQPLLRFLEMEKLFTRQPAGKPSSADEAQGRVSAARVRYLVLCYGVPVKILRDDTLKEAGAEKLPPELRRNEAAVDSELVLLPRSGQKLLLAGPFTNPVFATTNAAGLHPTNGVLLVARLDGPSAAIASNLVDLAVQAETDGLWGRAYFDLRGLTNGPYKSGDDSLRAAAQSSQRFGFETIVDEHSETFPAAFPLSQAGLYAGWYDNGVSGPFAQPRVEFMPGAFAYHLHSYSAAVVRSATQHWVGPLLAKGATATMGCVDEPYLNGTPDMGVFFSRFLQFGFSFGEAALAAQSSVSWQTTVIGDPLYRPFGKHPQLLHEDLARRGSRLIAWSHLRVVNLNLSSGGHVEEAVAYLTQLPDAKDSAVLQEKLGDLHSSLKQNYAAIEAWQRALRLEPSPQQQLRLLLMLGERLAAQNRDAEALAAHQKLLQDHPDYADRLAVCQKALVIAEKLKRSADAEQLRLEIKRLSPAP